MNSLDDLPHTWKFIHIVKTLSCIALFNPQAKNLDDAVANTALTLKLSNTMIDEPVLLTQAILLVAHNYSMKLIKQLLDKFSLSDNQCRVLIDELDKHFKFEINKSLIIEFLHILNNFKGACYGTTGTQQIDLPWYYLPAIRKVDYGITSSSRHSST